MAALDVNLASATLPTVASRLDWTRAFDLDGDGQHDDLVDPGSALPTPVELAIDYAASLQVRVRGSVTGTTNDVAWEVNLDGDTADAGDELDNVLLSVGEVRLTGSSEFALVIQSVSADVDGTGAGPLVGADLLSFALTVNEIGVYVEDVASLKVSGQLALASLKPTDVLDTRSWTALKMGNVVVSRASGSARSRPRPSRSSTAPRSASSSAATSTTRPPGSPMYAADRERAVNDTCPVCQGTGFDVRRRDDGIAVAIRCDCEFAHRGEALLRAARIPKRYAHCALDNFELHEPALEAALLVAREWVDRWPDRIEHGLLFLGPPGTGKTHLAVGIAREIAVRKGARVLFQEQRELLKELQATFDGGSVVGHVPGQMHPDLRDGRLEFADPIGQLNHLEVLALLLQFIHPDPERVGDEAPKAAQRHRGERQHGRRVLQRLRACQPQPVPVLVQRDLHARDAKEQHQRQRASSRHFLRRAFMCCLGRWRVRGD